MDDTFWWMVSEATEQRTVRLGDSSAISTHLIDSDFGVDGVYSSSFGKLSFGIKYSFGTGTRRSIVTVGGKRYSYGRRGMTFDRLYHILNAVCSHGGKPLLDYYFENNFRSAFGDRLAIEENKFNADVETELATLLLTTRRKKDGTPDLRTTKGKRLADFDAITKADRADRMEQLSKDIKAHIVQCFRSGRIPFKFAHAPYTIRKREKLGLTPIVAFYATGQLIQNLMLHYTVEEE